MLEGVLLHQVVARSAPGRRQKHCVELLIGICFRETEYVCVRVPAEHLNLFVALQVQEVTLEDLEVAPLAKAVDFCVFAHVCDFIRVQVHAYAETVKCELNYVAADTTESIEHIDSFFLVLLEVVARGRSTLLQLERLFDSLGEILSEGLRRDRVPAFFVNLNTSVKLAKQEVSTPVELLDVLWLHLKRLLVKLKDL